MKEVVVSDVWINQVLFYHHNIIGDTIFQRAWDYIKLSLIIFLCFLASLDKTHQYKQENILIIDNLCKWIIESFQIFGEKNQIIRLLGK